MSSMIATIPMVHLDTFQSSYNILRYGRSLYPTKNIGEVLDTSLVTGDKLRPSELVLQWKD